MPIELQFNEADTAYILNYAAARNINLSEFIRRSVFEKIEREKVKAENDLKKEKRVAEKRSAFNRILKLCKSVPNFDEKKALAEYREEKFGNANFD